jgi:aspartate kinase
MIVNKFGGASVKNAAAIRRLAAILRNQDNDTVIVVSAMGKTTNKLEKIVALKTEGDDSFNEALISLMNEHTETLKELFPSGTNPVYDVVIGVFSGLSKTLVEYNGDDYDFLYDQVVSAGEILSTRIVSAYLSSEGIRNRWIDIRRHLITDSSYREAKVEKDITEKNLNDAFNFSQSKIFVTQGFIGSDKDGNTTTLGREGSDYTAALIANLLDAEKVILWKDVDGIYNADPKLFDDAIILKEISYHEAIELSFYGAKVIHPKTVKPVQNKNIPLFVRNFNDTDSEGSVIRKIENFKSSFPVFIIKNAQTLLSVTPKDYSFVVEKHLSEIFTILNKQKIKVNLMQNSAVSFSVCCDKISHRKLNILLSGLKENFKILYNDNLELITIRHYTEESIKKLTAGRRILMEQRSRNTVQFVAG